MCSGIADQPPETSPRPVGCASSCALCAASERSIFLAVSLGYKTVDRLFLTFLFSRLSNRESNEDSSRDFGGFCSQCVALYCRVCSTKSARRRTNSPPIAWTNRGWRLKSLNAQYDGHTSSRLSMTVELVDLLACDWLLK